MSGTVNYRRLAGAQKTATPLGAAGDDPHKNADPFTYRLNMTVLDWVKVVINSLWLFPLRFFLIVIPSVTMGTIVLSIAILGERFDEKNPHPLRGWRRFLSNSVARVLSRVFLFGMGFHWIRVKGKPATTREAPIWTVVPHSSMLDMFIISLFGVPTYVAKQEVRSMPLFGFLITRTLRTIYVARSDPASRLSCTEEIKRRAGDKEEGWPRIMIFPEATTTSRKVLLRFKKGAFLPGLPVQAVAIKFQNRLNTMVWGDRGLGILTGLFLTICQFHNSLEVEFLPVHMPSAEEAVQPELFAEEVRREVGEATGIPLSDYSIDDMLVCRSARQLGLPHESGLVRYPLVQRELQLSMSDIKYWLRRFASMDTDRDGYITAEDLVRYLGVPNDACTQALFSALTKTGNGKVDFRHYLYGVVGLSLPFATDDSLRSMFEFFDEDGNGIVTMADITSRLPIQWREPSNVRGSPPSRHKGCDMCGCGRVRRRAQGPTPQLASLPPEMTYEQFCHAMLGNREYLLLYHECQTAALSSPASPHPSSPPPSSPPSSSPPPTSPHHIEVVIEN